LKISTYLQVPLIAFLDAENRNDAINALIDLLAHSGVIEKREEFRQAIFEREALVSTGIGMGVAVPHAKLESFQDFFIAVGIQQKKGIEWDAIDQAPVRLIFLIGGPNNRQTEYLQILSCLTAAIKDQNLRKELMLAENAEQALKVFSSF
jgi:PTS system nitrogen regulatory IIA component